MLPDTPTRKKNRSVSVIEPKPWNCRTMDNSAIISTSIASDFGTLGTLEVSMSGQVRSTTIREARPQKNSGFRQRAGAGVSIGRVRTESGAAKGVAPETRFGITINSSRISSSATSPARSISLPALHAFPWFLVAWPPQSTQHTLAGSSG